MDRLVNVSRPWSAFALAVCLGASLGVAWVTGAEAATRSGPGTGVGEDELP